MFGSQNEKELEQSQSNGANNGQSRQSIPASFAGELLEGSGFEEEVPEDSFEWREPK